jgi:hypothetical protein
MGMTNIDIRDWLHSMGIYDYDICDGVVHVVGDVDIYNRELTGIPVQFGYVSGNFYCSHNKLTTLVGCPSEVGGNFYCRHNALVSLKGCPSEVGGDFSCRYNRLKSLDGGPKEVSGGYHCVGNMLNSEPDTSGIEIGGMFKWY